MSDLARIDQPGTGVVHQPSPQPSQGLVQVRSVMDIPQRQWEQMWATALVLASSGKMVPEVLRGNPEGCMAVGLHCHALRIPFDVRSVTGGHFHIWEDNKGLKIQPSAQLMLGQLHKAGHDAWWGPCDDQSATVCVIRAGKTRQEDFTWTIAMAKRARLTEKDNWAKYPEAMLRAAACRMAARYAAPDALLGLDAYDVTMEALEASWEQNPAAVEAEGGAEFALPPAIEGGPGYQPPPPATPEVRERIRAAIRSLPAEKIARIGEEWRKAELPPLDHPDFDTTDAVDASQLVLEAMAAPVDDKLPNRGAGDDDAQGQGKAGVDSRGGEGAPGRVEAATSTASASEPAPTDRDEPTKVVTLMEALEASLAATKERPRPLAQQIAIQAQAAGVDHHHVIMAVTGGAKASAKDIDVEEGQLTLQAIAAIGRGEYTVVERNGAWVFEDVPETGRPFT